MEYVGAFYHAHDRVWQKSQALTPQDMPLLDCSVEADFKKPETSAHLSKLRVEFPDLEKWTLPRGAASQFGDEYYLGQWDHLFAKPSDEPIPSWDALLWLGKDHPIDIAPPTGLLANSRFRENHLFSLTPPSQVIIDPRFYALTIGVIPGRWTRSWMMCGTTFASWMVSLTALLIVLFGSKNLRRSIRPIKILFAFAKQFLQLCAPIGVPSTTCRSTPELVPTIARIAPSS